MLALRYVSLLALVVWVGGLLALGAIAAPAIFDVLAARVPTDGRVLAGAVFGETLRRFHHLSYGCAGVLLTSLTLRAVLGPRPRRYAIRAGLGVLMVAAVAYSAYFVEPRIERVPQDIGMAPSKLPEGDPRRVEFGRLHATSTALESVPLLGGLLLLFWELRD
jgi:hypothetical protein